MEAPILSFSSSSSSLLSTPDLNDSGNVGIFSDVNLLKYIFWYVCVDGPM